LSSVGLPCCPAAAAEDGGNTRWEMVGLVPLFDPPRHDTKETIERCHLVRCRRMLLAAIERALLFSP
jgi:hypothetical protein